MAFSEGGRFFGMSSRRGSVGVVDCSVRSRAGRYGDWEREGASESKLGWG